MHSMASPHDSTPLKTYIIHSIVSIYMIVLPFAMITLQWVWLPQLWAWPVIFAQPSKNSFLCLRERLIDQHLPEPCSLVELVSTNFDDVMIIIARVCATCAC
jgi:hypothetical protein